MKPKIDQIRCCKIRSQTQVWQSCVASSLDGSAESKPQIDSIPQRSQDSVSLVDFSTD